MKFPQEVNPGCSAALALFRAVKRNGLRGKWLGAQAALVLGVVLHTGLAAAQPNLVTNPGFETGNTSGWTPFGSPTLTVETAQVHSGTYACLVTNRSATYMGIAQSFVGVLQAGQIYNVSAWVRLVGSGSQSMQLTMQKTDAGGTAYAAVASGSISSSGWTQLSGQYTLNVSGTLTNLNFYAEVTSSSNAAYYIDDVSVTSAAIVPTNGQCNVNWTNVDQHIDGFGASSAWRGSWTSTQADMFFTTNSGTGTSFDGKTNFPFNGIGLSLLRSHIDYGGTTSSGETLTSGETSIMQMAQARGALVWSTPWTPAAGFKNTNDIYDSGNATQNGIAGGNFRGGDATNQAYASQLANYVVNMKNNYGVNLYAISIQNEPDAAVTSYEACQWTGAQFHDIVTNLYNALVAKGVGSTKIILPESENWSDPHNLAGPALSDPNTAADVSIIADHDYGDSGGTPAQKPVSQATWETEVSTFESYDGSISNGLYWAGRIHLFMTAAQVNAWHFWWLYPTGTDNEGLADNNGVPAKRMYVLGQFSRFVRPGYYRIDIGNNTGSALVSAYKDPNSGNFAIVAINSSAVVVTQAFNFVNVAGISSVTPWITSATMSLSNQAPVAVSGSTFSYALPAMSIVTFVGQGGGSVPTTLTLVSASNPSTYGDAVTFTATVKTNNVAVGGINGETVAFYNGASQLGTGTLNGSGQASYATTANQLNAGSRSITAVYGGDSSYGASTNSTALSQTVNPATLTYTANAASMIYGAPVPALGGSVSGFIGGDTQGNATAGTMSFTTSATSATPAGNYAISGTGLTANNGNYTFAQAAGNTTALSILPLVTPTFAAQAITIGAGGRQVSFSAQNGQTYKVLATSDLTLPMNLWTVVTNGTFGSGTVTITDNSTNTAQFYRIVSP